MANLLSLTIFDQLRAQGWATAENLVPSHICEELLEQLLDHKLQEQFKPAKTGQGVDLQPQGSIRGDQIHWLDSDSPAPLEIAFNLWLHAFIKDLNESLFLGIASREVHYAFYPPSKGYQKHRDVFNKNSDRLISLVLYLNKNWRPSDCGELVIYDENDKELEVAKISPQFGRLVLFLSGSIYHKVNFTNAERFSVTGWLKKRV